MHGSRRRRPARPERRGAESGRDEQERRRLGDGGRTDELQIGRHRRVRTQRAVAVVSSRPKSGVGRRVGHERVAGRVLRAGRAVVRPERRDSGESPADEQRAARVTRPADGLGHACRRGVARIFDETGRVPPALRVVEVEEIVAEREVGRVVRRKADGVAAHTAVVVDPRSPGPAAEGAKARDHGLLPLRRLTAERAAVVDVVCGDGGGSTSAKFSTATSR